LCGCEPSEPAPPTVEGRETSRAALAGPRLTLLVVDDASLAAAAGRLRGEWHSSTGAEFNVVEMTEVDLLACTQIECDALIFPAHDLGELAERGWLSPLPTDAIDDRDFGLDWPDIFETNRAAESVWGAQVVAVPFGSPVFVCAYRADWFERFGREPPRNWAEYQALAEFFSNHEGARGAIEPWGPGWAGLTLLARSATYAKHRDFYSPLFDMETMAPLVAGPPFVRALNEMAAVSRMAPVEFRAGGLADVREALSQGRSAMALVWLAPPASATVAEFARIPAGDAVAEFARIQAGDTVAEFARIPAGNDAAAGAAKPPALGFVELPGGAEMYNPSLGSWERRRDDDTGRVTFLPAAGRLGAVAEPTAHGDAAARLLAWLSGPEWSEQVAAASAATTLFRKSHLDSPQHWVGPQFGAGAAGPYAETVAKALDGHAFFAAPRISGRARYLQALDRAVRRVLSDEAKSQEALDTVADEWRTITDELGVDQQRSAYRRSLGLSNDQ